MTELVLASFNVHWGRGLRRDSWPPFDLVRACGQLQADVLVVQESWAPDGGEAQHDVVARELGMEVVAHAPMARIELDPKPTVVSRGGDPAAGGTGTWELAVLSRVPVAAAKVVDLPQLRLDVAARAAIVARLDLAGDELTLVATHWPHLEVGSPLLTPALRDLLPSADIPAAFAGDLNMWSWCIKAMAPRGWRRAVRGRTWPSPRPHSQIDHILVTRPVEVISGEVVDLVASDHRPVRARLRVR